MIMLISVTSHYSNVSLNALNNTVNLITYKEQRK